MGPDCVVPVAPKQLSKGLKRKTNQSESIFLHDVQYYCSQQYYQHGDQLSCRPDTLIFLFGGVAISAEGKDLVSLGHIPWPLQECRQIQ